ncbi:MAG TPA: MFS transporter [Conexibacter sp.]|jgi:MFS family permease
MKLRLSVVTVAAGLVLADASVVTLALPELLRALDTTVEGVAAVIAVYTIVLAAALLPAERLMRRVGPRTLGAAGFALFALASVICASADSLTVLLIARGIQALGGAAGIVAAFTLIDGGAPAGRRHWLAAAVLSAAIGPALGGALTQAFDWRAIFIVQIPIAGVAALTALATRPRSLAPGELAAPGSAGEGARGASASPPALAGHERVGERVRWLPAVALALLSAALTAVLFLLVLLLVAGWAITPLAAAATVTVLPLAAVVGARAGGPPRVRAAAGALLVGGGVLALAWLPSANVAWTFVPQMLAGAGMGMALPAFAGELLPEHTPHDAARLLTIRHVGIALVLIALAPLISSQLSSATDRAQLRGIALVLDAKLPPQDKLKLGPQLLSGVDAQQPRAGLDKALDAHRSDFSGDERAVYNQLATRVDDTLVTAVGEAFRWAFVIAGSLGMLAALLLILARDRAADAEAAREAAILERHRPPGARAAVAAAATAERHRPSGARPAVAAAATVERHRPSGARPAVAAAVTAALALSVAVPAAYAGLHHSIAPKPVVLANPCEGGSLPGSGGITGFLQDRALQLIDAGACRLGVSREELVLALSSDSEAKKFETKHGVDPRSVTSLLGGLLSP